MIISVTERGTFRRCKKQWDYSSFNRQALTALLPPTALSFGTLVHKCHEDWLLAPEKPVQDVVMNVIAQAQKDLIQRYKAKVGVGPEDKELSSFWEQAELCLDLMMSYERRWGSSLPEGFTLLQPEQTILVPIPGTEHPCQNSVHATSGGFPILDETCPECKGTKIARHFLEGTLDALIRDEQEQVWVLERKTFNQHPKIDVLQSNDQFIAYIWILNQLSIGPVGGLYYDGMWKRKWEGKRELADLFLREPLIRGPEEIANFGVQLRDEALDMAQSDLRIYRNRAWSGCWDCQFDRLCTAEFRGEDAEYIRERHYIARQRNDWQNEAAD